MGTKLYGGGRGGGRERQKGWVSGRRERDQVGFCKTRSVSCPGPSPLPCAGLFKAPKQRMQGAVVPTDPEGPTPSWKYVSMRLCDSSRGEGQSVQALRPGRCRRPAFQGSSCLALCCWQQLTSRGDPQPFARLPFRHMRCLQTPGRRAGGQSGLRLQQALQACPRPCPSRGQI